MQRRSAGRRFRGVAGLGAVTLASAAAALAVAGSSAASLPRCRPAQLRAWGSSLGAATGTVLFEFAFINTSAQECSLVGYPALQMLNAAGKPLKTIDEKYPIDAIPGVTGKPVSLAKGKRAYFDAFYANSTGTGDMVCPTAAALELTPPGSTQFVTLHGAGARIAPYAGSDTRAGCGIVRLTALTAKNLA